MTKEKQEPAPVEEQQPKKSGRPNKRQQANMEAALAQLEERADDDNDLIGRAIRKEAQKIVEQKADEIRKEINKVHRWKPSERVYRKFSSRELIAIFNGWFTLTYAFSIQSDELSPKGEPIETDFYICSQDVSQMDVNQRPPVNLAIQREFNKTVYGFAIIAPATAF